MGSSVMYCVVVSLKKGFCFLGTVGEQTLADGALLPSDLLFDSLRRVRLMIFSSVRSLARFSVDPRDQKNQQVGLRPALKGRIP